MLACLAMITLFLPTFAWAGWIIEDQEVDPDTGATQALYVQDEKAMAGNPNQGVKVIFDVKNSKLFFVSPEQKAYWSGTPEEFSKAKIVAMEAAMKKYMAKVSPEQKKMFQAQMKAMKQAALKKSQTPIPVAKVKKTNETKELAGKKTQKHQIFIKGNLVAEMWITPEINLSDEVDIKAMNKMIQSLSDEVDYSSSKQVVSLFENGYPLRVVEYEDGEQNETQRVGKVIKKDIPAEYFEVPQSYKKITLDKLNFE